MHTPDSVLYLRILNIIRMTNVQKEAICKMKSKCCFQKYRVRYFIKVAASCCHYTVCCKLFGLLAVGAGGPTASLKSAWNVARLTSTGFHSLNAAGIQTGNRDSLQDPVEGRFDNRGYSAEVIYSGSNKDNVNVMTVGTTGHSRRGGGRRNRRTGLQQRLQTACNDGTS